MQRDDDVPRDCPEDARAAASYLILLNESGRFPASVRSGDREIRRWRADGDDGSAEFGGDPSDPKAYEWVRDAGSVTAIIDLDPPSRSRSALAALRSVRPDSAALLLSQEADDEDRPGDGTLARAGRLRDVLRLDLDEELERLEAERRAFCLREFAAGPGIVPILIHADPDPDAVSSALAVAHLLGGSPERTPIVTLTEMTRPENQRMTDLLRIRVTRVTVDELRRFERVVTVDTQPRGLQQEGRPRLAVVDHHPAESGYTADFVDIRPSYGATATMMTEYLNASGESIPTGLATALLFGIRTDTDALSRGVTPADVQAYAALQEHADLPLIRRFERPSYTGAAAQAFGRALAEADCTDDLCAAHLGCLASDTTHVMADLADFCLGIEHVTWVAVTAHVADEVVITLRHAGSTPGAGEVARAIAKRTGNDASGGGHDTMARVSLSVARATEIFGGGVSTGAVRSLVRDVLSELSG